MHLSIPSGSGSGHVDQVPFCSLRNNSHGRSSLPAFHPTTPFSAAAAEQHSEQLHLAPEGRELTRRWQEQIEAGGSSSARGRKVDELSVHQPAMQSGGDSSPAAGGARRSFSSGSRRCEESNLTLTFGICFCSARRSRSFYCL